MSAMGKGQGHLLRLLTAGVCVLVAACASTREQVAALGNGDAEARRQAAIELLILGPRARRALPALMRAAEDERDAELRRLAAEAIGAVGPRAFDAHIVLTAAMRDEDVHVRRAAVVAMSELGKIPTSSFPAFILCLGDRDSLVREFTMNTFEELGSNGVGTLVRALSDTSAVVRRSAAITLGRLGGEAGHAAGALRKAKDDEDREVSRLADEALRRVAN